MEVIILILVATVHISFALAVFFDAKKMVEKGTDTFLRGELIWCLATLLGGIATVTVYWLIHHSNLRPGDLPRNEKNGEESGSQ